MRAIAISAFVVAAGAVAPATAAVAAPAADSPVISVQRNADGTVTETTYTPAPGVSSTELASRLTSRGVAGVTVGKSASVAAAVAACTNGTARTWPTGNACFARWSYNGHTRPQLIFRDRSNDLWPVGRAVTQWNDVSGIDSLYRDFSTGCPSSTVHCVIIYNARYGDTDWVGRTTRTLNAAQTYYSGAYIQLNESYGGTEAQRWNTACHEIGHVLGLGHNTSRSSCLYESRTSQRYPLANDKALVERYY